LLKILYFVAVFALPHAALSQSAATSTTSVEFFPLQQVRLLDSPFKQAQSLNLNYVMTLDADKLLAPFRREAGLAPEAKPYGSWESSGLDGHIGGHYLSALSLAYATTGDKQYQDRLDYVLAKLEEVQKANGNGYLGGVPNAETVWKKIAQGEIQADLFSLNERWVPWYNLHKTYAGLRDAYLIGGSDRALKMLEGLGDWTISLTKKLSDEQIQKMLYTEHGGMNEVFADYYAITGKKKYLDLARQFSEKRILDPLRERQDSLNGLHANTQIPKVVGFARIAQLAGDSGMHEAAEFFWNVVVNERSVAIGGNSVSEHFHEKNDFTSMMEDVQGPETCNTYNMLKLTEILYSMRGETKFIEYYERALYNHILSSQHPKTGGLVYFTPMRPQHYRVYSEVDNAMWCCVGSGIENHLKYEQFIYGHQADTLFINLFIPSRLNWHNKGVVLRQENRIPDEENTHIVVEKGGNFALHIRIPAWTITTPKVYLNGKPLTAQIDKGYLKIKRHWNNGDQLLIDLPMKTRTEQLPDGSPYFAVLHGPVVLSAPVNPKPEEKLNFSSDDSRMGHVATGELCPIYDAPMFISNNQDIVGKLQRIPGDKLRFTASDLIGNTSQSLELIPFFRIHDTRYMLYWQLTTAKDLKALKAKQKSEELAHLALTERTVDRIIAGQQQPEVEHNFKGQATEAGVHRSRHWRHASGWFSYELNNPAGSAEIIRVTLSKEDSGRRFKILLNGQLLDSITTEVFDSSGFYNLEYPMPRALKSQEVIEFRMEAEPGSIAGGLYEVRLLKKSP
jgi:DUF1680 family protein